MHTTSENENNHCSPRGSTDFTNGKAEFSRSRAEVVVGIQPAGAAKTSGRGKIRVRGPHVEYPSRKTGDTDGRRDRVLAGPGDTLRCQGPRRGLSAMRRSSWSMLAQDYAKRDDAPHRFHCG